MMNMQKTCDLELRLSSTSYHSDSSNTTVMESTSSGNQEQKENNYQRITIFYDGKMCVSSDVTHHQAKEILSMAASRSEMEKKPSLNGSDPSKKSTQLNHHHHHQLPNPKASMKKSLQSFLQKRKVRIQATSPYHQQHSRR